MAQEQINWDEIRQVRIEEEMELLETHVDKIWAVPLFVIPPKDTFVLSNQIAFIEAQIYAVPKPIVRWYKNGKLITSSQFPSIKKHHYEPETYALEFEKVTASDMGTYTCVARNCYGSISSSATLEITDLETEEGPRFLKTLNTTEILIKSNGSLEVKIWGTPKPTVEWLKNMKPLEENCRIKVSHKEPHTYLLCIDNAKPEDTGLYSCQAHNNAGNISTTAMVYVENLENLSKKWSEDLAH